MHEYIAWSLKYRWGTVGINMYVRSIPDCGMHEEACATAIAVLKTKPTLKTRPAFWP